MTTVRYPSQMTPDIGTHADGPVSPGRLPRIARKLGAIGVLAAALSIVRPCDVPRMGQPTARPQAGLAAAADHQLRLPLPQVALLYREHATASVLSVVPLPLSGGHLMGSIQRQVI